MLLSDGLQIFLSFMFCTAAPDETLPYTSFIAAGLRAEPASTPSLGLVTRRWAAGPVIENWIKTFKCSASAGHCGN